MKKIELITSFLIGLNLVAVEQLDSWVESPEIIPSGRSMGVAGTNNGTGVGGIVLYRQSYDAVISIERYPHKAHPAELLFGQVCAWLMDNDAERDDIARPQVNVDILDDSTADIEITISFEEDVYAVPDPAGTIVIGGQNYRLADVEIDYAEQGDLAT